MPHYRNFRGRYSNTLNPREEAYRNRRNEQFEQEVFVPRSQNITIRPTGQTRGRSAFRRTFADRSRANELVKDSTRPEQTRIADKFASEELLKTERVDTYIAEVEFKSGDLMTSPFTARLSSTSTTEVIPIKIAEAAIISRLLSDLSQTGFHDLETSPQGKLFWSQFKAATPNIIAAYEAICSVKITDAILYLKPYKDLANVIAAVSTAQNLRLGYYLALVPDFRLLLYMINNITTLNTEEVQAEIIRRMSIVLPDLPIEGRALQLGDIQKIIITVPENRKELAAIRRAAINGRVNQIANNPGLTELELSYSYSILQELVDQQLRNIPSNCLKEINLNPTIKERTNLCVNQALSTATIAASMSPFVNYDNWMNTNVLCGVIPYNTLYNNKGVLMNSLYSTCSINVNQDVFRNIGSGAWRLIRKIEGRKGELIDDLARISAKIL